MREGQYLGRPPVDIRAVGSLRLQRSLMRGCSSYADAAGGLSQVPAFPPLQHFRPAATVNGNENVRLVELYADHPGLFKQRLARMFHEPRARVTSGRLQPRVTQLGDDA
jgi:hypothetical protein